MTNVKISKTATKLTIEVDLSVQGKPSKTGKSLVIASTEGNVRIEPNSDTFIGLNVYKTR